MDRLLLVDGHSNLYRAHFALRDNLTAPDGTPTGAAYGFLRMLHRMLEDLRPTHVGVAFDVSRITFRTRLDERYKAQRKPMPPELKAQIPYVRQALEHLGIPILELPDFEADDVIGTLAVKAAKVPMECIIATSDKDMLQLIRDPWIKVWHTRHERLLDEAAAEELFGVPPARVVDVLALMGDASDNVPGCPGIGEKGARKLVSQWGSVEDIYRHLDEVTPGRPRNALANNRNEVELSRRLVEIRTDLDVPLDLEALRRSDPNVAGLADLYRQLGFTSLLAALDLTDGEARRLTIRMVPVETLMHSPGALVLGEDLAVVATPGDVQACRAPSREIVAVLGPAIDAGWTVFSSKEVIRTLRDNGVAWAGQPRDLVLAAYLLNPGEEMSLDAIARRHLAVLKPAPDAGDPELSVAGERALWIRDAAEAVFSELEASHLRGVYERIEAPLAPVLESMERLGIRLDEKVLADLSSRLASSLADLQREIFNEAGTAFNINSPRQLGEVMFERLKYPVIKRTAKTRRPSTGVEVLAELARRRFRLPALILEYREQSKLKSTYVDALPRQVGPDGRIHTRFHQTVTSTGRLSSSDPNLQNIPVRSELGREVRRAFVAEPGFSLVAADYSQIELRVLAHMSGDTNLIEAFRDGEDIHRATAAAILGKAPRDVTTAERRAAKTVNFGLIYGMGAYSLARDLGVDVAQAQAFIDTYFERFPQVKAYMDGLREVARREGVVTTLFGRVRRIANLDHSSATVRAAAERMAINAPIQGTAADLIKLAMIELDRRLEGREARLLLQVHDELILETPHGTERDVASLVRDVMEHQVELKVPLVVDVGWGDSWYDAK
ncbi:MAG: DNA polymerase I [Acidobacteria bacterium]|nr:DNA polymerase I [Acidobacteriota bacterium]